MILKFFYSLLFMMALVMPAMAQDAATEQTTAEKTVRDFVPGILLEPAQKAALETDKIENTVFPTDAYLSQQLTSQELYALYEAGEYNKVVFGLLRLARLGDSLAEETIGLMYRFGQGLKQDNAQAFRWFTRAAQDMRPLSQHHLGSMYYAGEHVNKDMIKAATWMQLAARNYPAGPSRNQALSDLKNIHLRLSRFEKNQADLQVRRYIQRYGTTARNTAAQNTPVEAAPAETATP